MENIKRFVFTLEHENAGRQTVANTQPWNEKMLPWLVLIPVSK